MHFRTWQRLAAGFAMIGSHRIRGKRLIEAQI
jgi:hypothetical protein